MNEDRALRYDHVLNYQRQKYLLFVKRNHLEGRVLPAGAFYPLDDEQTEARGQLVPSAGALVSLETGTHPVSANADFDGIPIDVYLDRITAGASLKVVDVLQAYHPGPEQGNGLYSAVFRARRRVIRRRCALFCLWCQIVPRCR